tara:strand:- start:190 stop:864 length:675 start_codon:yes stop_codon:yes gene_type:complete
MPIQRVLKTNAVKAAHIAANAVGSSEIDLTASYAFTGTVTGAGSMEKVSSSSTTGTGLSSVQIDLPTTTDFVALKLILRGLKCESATNSYWGIRFRSSGGSYITSTSYSYLFAQCYSNDSSNSTSYFHDINGTEVLVGGYTGDGSDDAEMTAIEIDLHNSQTSGRYTRGFLHSGIEKRHNDTYHYDHDGSFYVSTTNVLDQIQIRVNTDAAFTSYGYALYKVLF